MSFESLGLKPELLRAVAAQGYTEPTPVQAEAIPIVLERRDLLAGAQTGTGKTAAFVLPILQLLHENRPAPRHPIGPRPKGATGMRIRCLVLTPTRELALQVEEMIRTYGHDRPVRSTTIYGGVGYDAQIRAIQGGPEIVVATPGRLLDIVGQGKIDLHWVEILVLDEADRMLDMGFIRDIRKILALLPQRRQNLLFSATFSDDVRDLAATLLHDPAYVQIARRNAPIELVRQVVYPVDRARKRELLSHLIRSGRIDRALVFARTKHGAARLAEQLYRDGIDAAAIHGDMGQSQRVRALNAFKDGRLAILVATEVASRGLDIDGLPHVVNYEMPVVAHDYVHRIGRTGRAGMEGDAISLVSVDELGLLADIEALLRQRIPQVTVPGFEVDRSIQPQAIRGIRSPSGRSSGARRPTAGRGRPSGVPVRGRQPAYRSPNFPTGAQRSPNFPTGAQRSPNSSPGAPRTTTHAAPRTSSASVQRHGPSSAPSRQFTVMPGERFAKAGSTS